MTLGTREESAFAYKVVDLGDVCYGSTAEVQQPITQRTAYGGIADEKSARNPDSKGPGSARSGHSPSELTSFPLVRLKPEFPITRKKRAVKSTTT